ncbi:unnamed protein product [Protopolystoma xenopodis]|uniref:Uncharacterized protein n=1 Tax=Protopolystoma xenopodis TaxID=117903 RepID=A0A448WEW9_9PLAT|nr:unnamed protein product [Protopolystoma xenopodis]
MLTNRLECRSAVFPYSQKNSKVLSCGRSSGMNSSAKALQDKQNQLNQNKLDSEKTSLPIRHTASHSYAVVFHPSTNTSNASMPVVSHTSSSSEMGPPSLTFSSNCQNVRHNILEEKFTENKCTTGQTNLKI